MSSFVSYQGRAGESVLGNFPHSYFDLTFVTYSLHVLNS